jgi:hypothetical protein
MTDLVTDFLGFTSESTNQSGARVVPVFLVQNIFEYACLFTYRSLLQNLVFEVSGRESASPTVWKKN